MIIYKNNPTYPCVTFESKQSKEYEGTYTVEHSNSGIPLRLEIAARFVAAHIATGRTPYKEMHETYLEIADKLIEAHNKTCEGEK